MRSRWRRGKEGILDRLAQFEHESGEEPILRANNIHYDIARKTRAVTEGGMGAIHLLARQTGLIDEIDGRVHLLKQHRPYHESDHVLNIAYNSMCGGTCLEDIELRRNNAVYLDGLDATCIPDPTTAGDFCRRFTRPDVEDLMRAINETRLRVWRKQGAAFLDEAIVEADGTIVETCGECKQGTDFAYDGKYGYHPLVVSLANTGEPLFVENRSGNRPSHEGAAARFDQAFELVRRAGFRNVTARGDTDFTQTRHLDRWDDQGVRFVFGIDAMPNLVRLAETLPSDLFTPLERPAKYTAEGEPRAKPPRVKDLVVEQRGYLNIHLLQEEVAEWSYQPGQCKRPYRLIVLKKTLTVERGQIMLFPEVRYFFYLTNRTDLSPAEVVWFANDRCAQEKLLQQLKSGVRSLRTPVDTLLSNWAYMVMASLAWSLKAWFALLLPVSPRWKEQHECERDLVLKMEFKTFQNAFIRIAAQIIRTGRRILFRLLEWNPWQMMLLRLVDALHTKRLC
jgi:hypothetical protein